MIAGMRGSRWGRGPDPPPPMKKYKNIGFPSNIGPNPFNHKATQPEFNVGPSSTMAFRWRADGGTLMLVFGSSLPLI